MTLAPDAARYRRRIDRQNPGCLVFLVDRSASMEEPIAGSPLSKAEAVAEQLNTLLFELVQRCSKSQEELPRPYFAVSVIGYGTDEDGVPQVESALRGTAAGSDLTWTSDLAVSTLRLEQRNRTTANGRVATYRFPVWLDAVAAGGTPMCAALDRAGRTLKAWVDRYPDAFPPIVINLTDGESTDGDPTRLAERIRSLGTSDGGVLLFNIVFSALAEAPTLFPAAAGGIGDAYGRTLWSLSSELPPFMADAARRRGIQVTAGARGFAFNADLQALVAFLNVGTETAHLLR